MKGNNPEKPFLNKFIFIAILVVAAFFSSNSPIFADSAPNGHTPGTQTEDSVDLNLADYYQLNNGQSVSDVFSKPADMVNLVVSLLFVAAGLVLFFMIIVAGFGMIKGDSKEAEKAKSSITTAVIGFVIMFSAYWIIQIIELITGVQILF